MIRYLRGVSLVLITLLFSSSLFAQCQESESKQHSTIFTQASKFSDDVILYAIAEVESGSKDEKRGRKGELSRYQIMRSVWDYHNPGSPDGRKNKIKAKQTAIKELNRIKKTIRSKTKKEATLMQVYCAWNLGLQGFAKRRFYVDRCPASTIDRAERFQNIALSKI